MAYHSFLAYDDFLACYLAHDSFLDPNGIYEDRSIYIIPLWPNAVCKIIHVFVLPSHLNVSSADLTGFYRSSKSNCLLVSLPSFVKVPFLAGKYIQLRESKYDIKMVRYDMVVVQLIISSQEGEGGLSVEF